MKNINNFLEYCELSRPQLFSYIELQQGEEAKSENRFNTESGGGNFRKQTGQKK